MGTSRWNAWGGRERLLSKSLPQVVVGDAMDCPRRPAIRNKCVTNKPPGLCGDRNSGNMAKRARRCNFSCEEHRREAALISKANFKAAHRVGEQALDGRLPSSDSEMATDVVAKPRDVPIVFVEVRRRSFPLSFVNSVELRTDDLERWHLVQFLNHCGELKQCRDGSPKKVESTTCSSTLIQPAQLLWSLASQFDSKILKQHAKAGDACMGLLVTASGKDARQGPTSRSCSEPPSHNLEFTLRPPAHQRRR